MILRKNLSSCHRSAEELYPYIQLTSLVENHCRGYFGYHWMDDRISIALLFKRNNINFTILTEVAAGQPCPENMSNWMSNILGYIYI